MKKIKELFIRLKNIFWGENVVTLLSKEDFTMEDKIRAIIGTGANISDFMVKIMDEGMLMRLDSRGREIYIIQVIDKYLEIKSKIEAEEFIYHQVID